MRKAVFAAAAILMSRAALAENVIVTSADDGKTITLALGQCIDVKLQAQDWSLPTDTRAWPYLEMHSATSEATGPDTPVTTDIVLCAEQPGEGLVNLSYSQPWEKNTPIWKTLAFTVKVGK